MQVSERLYTGPVKNILKEEPRIGEWCLTVCFRFAGDQVFPEFLFCDTKSSLDANREIREALLVIIAVAYRIVHHPDAKRIHKMQLVFNAGFRLSS